MTQLPAPSVQPLRVIPLGGLHEIGKNTCVFEYGDDLMLVDAGLSFPSDGMHGVNVVMPDTTYLRENRKRIRGMIVTHGHEDHIGGIAHHLKHFDIPVIYGPRLALSLLQGKMEEAGVAGRTTTRTVKPRETVQVGRHFKVEFIRNTHSIADSFSLAITTPVGVVVFTGDFKFDHTPVDGEVFDIHRLAHYGEQGVLCLFSDSTNAELPGFTPPERSVFPNLDRHFSQARGRLLVTTFASSVHRVSMILELALKHGRKVGLLGRSMLNVVAKARELGYIRCPDDLFVPMKQIRDLPDRETLLLMTGSQGEHLAALSRISRGEHPHVQLKTTDTVVFSASPIPGNTIAVVNTIDRLMILGATVVYGKDKGIHVSGHGSQEDEKLMLALTRPRFFVPVHGEHRMLVQHCRTAESMGVAADRMLVVNNGDVVELTPESIRRGEPVQAGIELLDNSRNGVVDDHVLKERQQLAQDGAVTLLASITGSGQMGAPVRVQRSGVVVSADHARLCQWAEREVQWVLEHRWQQLCRGRGDAAEIDWVGVQREIELGMQRRLRRELEIEPLVVVMVQPAGKDAGIYTVKLEDDVASSSRAGGQGRPLGNSASSNPMLRPGASNGNGATPHAGQSTNPALAGARRRGGISMNGSNRNGTVPNGVADPAVVPSAANGVANGVTTVAQEGGAAAAPAAANGVMAAAARGSEAALQDANRLRRRRSRSSTR